MDCDKMCGISLRVWEVMGIVRSNGTLEMIVQRAIPSTVLHTLFLPSSLDHTPSSDHTFIRLILSGLCPMVLSSRALSAEAKTSPGTPEAVNSSCLSGVEDVQCEGEV